jgi:hypothetical protein
MPIAFRAATDYTTTSAAPTPAKPTGTASGDVLLAVVSLYTGSDAIAITPPSGWDLISNAQYTTLMRQTMYIKVAGGSEPASYTWTISSSSYVDVHIIALTGVNTTTPQDATATTNSGTATTRSALGLTIVTPGAWIVVASTGFDFATPTPSGMTARTPYLFTEARATAGATGDRTATASADEWTAIMVALRPALISLSPLPNGPRLSQSILAR